MKKFFAWYRDIMHDRWKNKSDQQNDDNTRGCIIGLTLHTLFIIILIMGLIISNRKTIVRFIEKKAINDNVKVICHNYVNCDNIKITWTYSVFDPVIIYENSEQIFTKTNEVGDHIFAIYYKNKQVSEISQFIAKDWVKHDYYFGVYRNLSDKLHVIVIIDGEYNHFKQIDFY